MNVLKHVHVYLFESTKKKKKNYCARSGPRDRLMSMAGASLDRTHLVTSVMYTLKLPLAAHVATKIIYRLPSWSKPSNRILQKKKTEHGTPCHRGFKSWREPRRLVAILLCHPLSSYWAMGDNESNNLEPDFWRWRPCIRLKRLTGYFFGDWRDRFFLLLTSFNSCFQYN